MKRYFCTLVILASVFHAPAQMTDPIRSARYSNPSQKVTKLKARGERIDDSTVKLSWQSQGETTNNNFEVQRLFYDNSSDTYMQVGKVGGYGSTIRKAKYELVDENDYTGITFYRIRQLNAKGQLVAARLISVEGEPETAVFPNAAMAADPGLPFPGFQQENPMNQMIFDFKRNLGITFYGVDLFNFGNILSLRELPPHNGIYIIQAQDKIKKRDTSIMRH